MNAVILVVDDEPAQLEALSGYLKKQGHDILKAENGKKGLEHVRARPVELVLTDMRMPEMGGLDFLREIRKINPETGVVVMTAFGSVEDAVEAMKAGAEDYIQKPIHLDQLDIVVGKVLERRRLAGENQKLREALEARKDFRRLIASSPEMEKVLGLAGRAAKSKATVLIQGESGTGKEVLARAVHLAGPRRDKPFIPVNMAALPETLVESELFGHEKGAFTGADRARKGRFELAGGGTLFIDEVGDIPAPVQVKLLRVLQEKTFERLGGTSHEADVRVIAATNRSLEEEVRRGRFREDLFFRLNVISIFIPPLRERRGEIPLLVDHFLRKYAEEEDKPVPSVSREAMRALIEHDYPGNVRELENAIQRAVVLAGGDLLSLEDLPPGMLKLRKPAPAEDKGRFAEQVEGLEIRLIRVALESAEGNQSGAARSLGISERHLRYKLKKYGLK
jgi:two-component system NtrC family response regulator